MKNLQALVVAGYFVQKGSGLAIFIPIESCAPRDVAVMEQWSLAQSKVEAAGEAPSQVALLDLPAERVERCTRTQCALSASDGHFVADGFAIELSHLKTHKRRLVQQYIEEASMRPLIQSRFTFRLDHNGALQGWSRSRSEDAKLEASGPHRGTPGIAVASEMRSNAPVSVQGAS